VVEIANGCADALLVSVASSQTVISKGAVERRTLPVSGALARILHPIPGGGFLRRGNRT
jgi:hypothetical protein